MQGDLEQEISNRADGDTNLQAQINNINNTVNDHGTRITTLETRMSTAESNITNNYNNLNIRVTALENKIGIGSNPPGALADGKIYLQYF